MIIKKQFIFLFVLSFFFSLQNSQLSFAKAKFKEGEPIPFHLKQENSEVKLPQKKLNDLTEKYLFEASNRERENKKLQTLAINPLLLQAARAHSQDILKRNYFSHFSPEGKSVLDRLRQIKPGYEESCGENLHHIFSSEGFSDVEAIAKQMMDDWMHSPDHRKNILSSEYSLMALGCASDTAQIFCTQVFSGPKL